MGSSSVACSCLLIVGKSSLFLGSKANPIWSGHTFPTCHKTLSSPKSAQSAVRHTRRRFVIFHLFIVFPCFSNVKSHATSHGSITYRHVAIGASAISLLHSFSNSKIDLRGSSNFVSQTSNSYNFLLEIEKQCHKQTPSPC